MQRAHISQVYVISRKFAAISRHDTVVKTRAIHVAILTVLMCSVLEVNYTSELTVEARVWVIRRQRLAWCIN